MRRRIFFISIASVFLVFCVCFWNHRSVSLAESLWSVPQSADDKDAKSKDDKVKAALANQDRDTLIVGNEKGEITAKYDTKELRKEGYKSLSDFVEKAGSKECKKISSKCRKCPNGKIYCTNDSQFAADERLAQHP